MDKDSNDRAINLEWPTQSPNKMAIESFYVASGDTKTSETIRNIVARPNFVWPFP
jgi:hypothetical protein